MKITYDPEANAGYVRFTKNKVAMTVGCSFNIYIDLDSDGRLIGIEFLSASHTMPKYLYDLVREDS